MIDLFKTMMEDGNLTWPEAFVMLGTVAAVATAATVIMWRITR